MFGRVFFRDSSPTINLVLTCTSFTLTFFVHPLNKIVFDRVNSGVNEGGALILALSLVNNTAILVNFLPACSGVNATTPVLLVVLHLVRNVNLKKR